MMRNRGKLQIVASDRAINPHQVSEKKNIKFIK